MALSISGTAFLQAASMGLSFVTAVILTRTLGASGYGAYAYAMAWVGFLLIPAVLGMDRFLVRGVAMYRASHEWGLLRGLVSWANRSVLSVSMLMALAATVIGYLVLPPALRATFCLAMPLLPVTALVIVRQSTMIGLRRAVSGQFPEFLLRPALFVLLLIPFLAGFGLSLTSELAMTLNVSSVIVAFAVGVALLRRGFPVEAQTARPGYNSRAWRRAAVPMMLLGGMWLVNPLVSTIMLGSFRGAHDVGVYTVVARAADIMLIALVAITTPLSPRVAELFAAGDLVSMQRVVAKAARVSVYWSAPVAVTLIAFSGPLLSIFGSQFAGAGLALSIMVCGQFVNSAAGPAGIVLMMTKHERAAAVGVGAGLLVNIALNLLLVPSLGVNGAAIGTTASRIIWNGALVGYAWMQLRINTTVARRTGRDGSVDDAARAEVNVVTGLQRVHPPTESSAMNRDGTRSPGADANLIARRLTPLLKSSIGFIVIGAQKAGTTSLFEYVRQHPNVYMPPQKEIAFFSSDVNYARGWDWYSSVTLANAPPGAVCGEASVGYMSGTPDRRPAANGRIASPGSHRGAREDVIPQRIREHAPNARLICVLRDPIERCLSHYRMTVLAGAEQRPFEAAIFDMLREDALEQARSSITGDNGYVVRGEYFRILSGYWRTFPSEQLMSVFSSDLQSRPADVVSQIFAFIGVDPGFRPDEIGRRYREAAVARRIPGLNLYAWQKRLSRTGTPRVLWHTLPPRARAAISARYDRASFGVEMWNARRGEVDEDMPVHVRDRLVAHFRADTEALARALGVAVPWLADWGGPPTTDVGPSNPARFGSRP